MSNCSLQESNINMEQLHADKDSILSSFKDELRTDVNATLSSFKDELMTDVNATLSSFKDELRTDVNTTLSSFKDELRVDMESIKQDTQRLKKSMKEVKQKMVRTKNYNYINKCLIGPSLCLQGLVEKINENDTSPHEDISKIFEILKKKHLNDIEDVYEYPHYMEEAMDGIIESMSHVFNITKQYVFWRSEFLSSSLNPVYVNLTRKYPVLIFSLNESDKKWTFDILLPLLLLRQPKLSEMFTNVGDIRQVYEACSFRNEEERTIIEKLMNNENFQTSINSGLEKIEFLKVSNTRFQEKHPMAQTCTDFVTGFMDAFASHCSEINIQVEKMEGYFWGVAHNWIRFSSTTGDTKAYVEFDLTMSQFFKCEPFSDWNICFVDVGDIRCVRHNSCDYDPNVF